MKRNNPLFKIAIKFAALGAILSIFLFLTLHVIDKNPLSNGKMFDLILFPLIIIFGVKEFKNYWNNKELRFWQGLGIGFTSTFIIAIISANFILGFTKWVDPQLLESYKESRVRLFTENKGQIIESLKEETYNKTLASVNNISSADVALDDFYKKILIGFFVTIIISVVLRR